MDVPQCVMQRIDKRSMGRDEWRFLYGSIRAHKSQAGPGGRRHIGFMVFAKGGSLQATWIPGVRAWWWLCYSRQSRFEDLKLKQLLRGRNG